MLKHLENLCNLCAVSGNEDAVRQYVIGVLEQTDGVSWEIDPLGNVLVKKQGRRPAAHRWMISAHMDEVGAIVTYVHTDGTLQLAPVGGVEASVILGRQVLVGDDHRVGVVGSKPIHLLTKEEQKTPAKWSSLVLDIGVSDAEEARQTAPPGTPVYFMPDFRRLHENCICSKAIDDRAGCAVLLHLLQQEMPFDFTAAFLVQEEIGLRGARTAAYTVNPDFALVLEATTAADIVGTTDDARVCELGGGPVISFMDHSTLYDRQMYQTAFAVGKKHGIPCQTKSRIAGGNDSGAIHVSRGGVRTLAISLPCRYLHAPSGVAAISDLENLAEMIPLLMEEIQTREK